MNLRPPGYEFTPWRIVSFFIVQKTVEKQGFFSTPSLLSYRKIVELFVMELN